MIRVTDGPAAGRTFACRRAPKYLRVVRAEQLELVPDDPAAGWDVLDQLEDTPAANEEVFVYRIVEGTWRVVIICRIPGDGGGRFELGEYRFVAQPGEATLRDTELWRAWAKEQP